MQRKSILYIICLLILLTTGAYAKPVRHVVVVLVPGATLDDMATQMPVLHGLMPHGALGLMNSRTAASAERDSLWQKFAIQIPPDRSSLESAYLTLGSGARGDADSTAGEAANRNETILNSPVSKIYQRRMGTDPGITEIIHTEVPALIYQNKPLSYKLQPGLLGSLIRKQNLRTACIGNSDIPQQMHRELVLLAMDSQGQVDLGDVSADMLIKDHSIPGGVRTNPAKAIQEFKRVVPQASLIVIETGDSARVDRYIPFMKDKQAIRQLHRCFHRTDTLLKDILGEVDLKQDLLIILSPITSRNSWRAGNRLSPVVMLGSGISPGLLISPSTRNPGLITNTDIAPTILDSLEIAIPKTIVGRPVKIKATPHALEALLQYNKRQALLSTKQGSIPRVFTWVQAAILALAVILILGFPSWISKKLIQVLILAPAAFSTALLVTGSFPGVAANLTYPLVAAVALGLSLLCVVLFRRPVMVVTALAGIFTLCVLADLFRGGPWIMNSVFGYSASEGARYYGIGNEYMGYLVGASALLAAWIFEKLHSQRFFGLILAAMILGTCMLAIGLPSMGANSGGGIAAVACSASAILLLSGAKLTKKSMILVMGATILFLGGLVAMDLLKGSSSQSHIGHAARAIATGGSGEAFSIIIRKLSMNMKLLQYSPSSRLMFLGMIISCWLLYQNRDSLKKHTAFHAGIQAILVGAAAGFIFNDSGVLAAANTLVFSAAAMVAYEIENTHQASNRILSAKSNLLRIHKMIGGSIES